MTADEYMKKLADPLWYGEQDENGVDLSLIREILKLTPTERIRRADKARLDALRLREYGRIATRKRS
jgi:hypothetical protein